MSDIASESPAAAGSSGLGEDERAELLRLRAEVANAITDSTWIQVNTAAHQAVVTALSGGKGAVSTQNGQVVLDLAPFINIVKQNLVARGFTLASQERTRP